MTALREDAYFDHDADIGIVGCGDTVEQAFESAARAVFAIVSDVAGLRSETTVQFELALVTWLNLLLAHAREQQAVFSRFRLRREGNTWRGEASGQHWNAAMDRGVEVKGATLTMLSVKQHDGRWEARCVVDV
jgi:SHS2 domain-containing protein